MPIVDANDPHVWQTQWQRRLPGGRVLGYCREGFYESRQSYARKMMKGLELKSGDAMLMIGAGFGWTCEWLEQEGITVTATDISIYIQEHKSTESKHEILDLDVLDPDARKELRGEYRWVVSEQVLPWYTIDEAKALDKAMSELGPTAHFLTPWLECKDPEPEPKWSWLTLPAWKEHLPEARIIDARNGEFV